MHLGSSVALACVILLRRGSLVAGVCATSFRAPQGRSLSYNYQRRPWRVLGIIRRLPPEVWGAIEFRPLAFIGIPSGIGIFGTRDFPAVQLSYFSRLDRRCGGVCRSSNAG